MVPEATTSVSRGPDSRVSEDDERRKIEDARDASKSDMEHLGGDVPSSIWEGSLLVFAA